MAKNTKSTRDIPEYMIFYRQVNYTIFRLLWKLRTDGKTMEDFYSEIHIDRNRYRSIVRNETRTPRLGKEAIELCLKSGVPQEIFLGGAKFYIKEISNEEWAKYFENSEFALTKDKAGKWKEYKKECIKFEEKLKDILRVVPMTKNPSDSLFAAYTYFVKGIKVDGSEVLSMLKALENDLRGMKFSLLESVGIDDLVEYAAALKNQWEMVSTIISYKKFKN